MTDQCWRKLASQARTRGNVFERLAHCCFRLRLPSTVNSPITALVFRPREAESWLMEPCSVVACTCSPRYGPPPSHQPWQSVGDAAFALSVLVLMCLLLSRNYFFAENQVMSDGEDDLPSNVVPIQCARWSSGLLCQFKTCSASFCFPHTSEINLRVDPQQNVVWTAHGAFLHGKCQRHFRP